MTALPPGFAAAAAAAGAPLDAEAEVLLARFLDLLLAENEVQNLTTVTGTGEMATDHLLDSLALGGAAAALGVDLRQVVNCVDIGTGGGFPGIPLAIAFPRTRWVLVESEGAKVGWLERAAAALGLAALQVFRGRGRQVRHDRPDLEGACSLVTARAVGSLGTVCREARGLLRPGGLLLCPKGPGLDDAERALGEREARKSRLVPAGDVPMAVPGRSRFCVAYRMEQEEACGKPEARDGVLP